MPQYKLYYFDIRGRGEPIRWLFKYAGVEFEDIRIQFKEWPTMENKQELGMVFGQMPLLVENDDFKLVQSLSIERYLARKFGLTGKSGKEAAVAEFVLDGIMDMSQHYPWGERDPEEKAKKADEALTNKFPKFLDVFEILLGDTTGDYFLESGPSFADTHFAAKLNFFTEVKPGLIDAYPRIKKVYGLVTECKSIKTWIEERPERPY